jgi:hypothetical protein
LKKKFFISLISVIALLTVLIVGCDVGGDVGAPAEFSRLRIANTFIESWNSAGSGFVRMSLPTSSTTIVGTDTTDTLTNKTLTTPVIAWSTTFTNVICGSANISAAGSSVVVTHGLGGTPSYVFLTQKSALGTSASSTGVNGVYFTSANSTYFTINAMAAANTSTAINWIAIR